MLRNGHRPSICIYFNKKMGKLHRKKGSEDKMTKVDHIEKEKRVYQVGLMLRRKPISFIIEYVRTEWGLQKAQAYNYIKDARAEWQKYFSQVKRCGKSYYVSQLRDLKDQAYNRKVVIGRGENKDKVTIADLGLVFEISKEEAKLMGIYPSEKHDIKVKGELKIIDAKQKLIEKIDKLSKKKENGG